MDTQEIRMSKEDTRNLNGHICSQLISELKEEFDRQDYLLERYTRAKKLKELRKISDPTQADIICAYEKYITDVAVGYGIGKKPTYYNNQTKTVSKTKTIFNVEKEKIIPRDSDKNRKEKSDEFLNLIFELQKSNHDQKENIRLTRKAFITSKAYEIIYTNENGDIRYKMLNGHVALIKSDDLESKTIGFLRTYKSKKKNFANGYLSDVEYDVIELYTHYKRVYYTSEDGYEKEHNIYSNGQKPFDEDFEIPIVSIEMPYGIGLFEQQVSEVRGYELVTNNTKKILNYNDDAILMISGVMFLNGESQDEIDEVVERYRTTGVIFTGSEEDGCGAKWLTKQVNDATNQSHKDNLKNDIYGVAGLFNPENDSAVYQNTLSLVFKLYGLETKMSEYEEIFKDAMKRRIKIISQIINKKYNENYNWQDIDLTMFRNLPTNTNEELNFANQMRDILPRDVIYEQLSFVTDAQEMLKRYEDDQIRQAKLDAKIAKIMSEATQDDMSSDNPYLNGNNQNGDSENQKDDNNSDEEDNNEEKSNIEDSKNNNSNNLKYKKEK